MIAKQPPEVKQFSRLSPVLAQKCFDFSSHGHYYRAPMLGVLPEQIATDQLLAAGGHLQGRLQLGSMLRLAAILPLEQPAATTVEVDLKLVEDPQRRLWLEGRVRVVLALVCERCQETMDWPVSAEVGLYLARNDADAAEVGEEADVVIVGDSLKLHELIEDEMILALPLVAKHPAGTVCGDQGLQGPIAESGERDNPFAILKTLKN